MNMIFGVKDRPKFGQTILFAIQQLLAIMAATLVVPVITNGATGSTLSPAAALFGATFLMVVDNIARIATTTEIPLGILTSFIGAPVFVYLILTGGGHQHER